jgi:hypothetical protein
MANGLKFSDQELADLRRVAYGGYKKTAPRSVRRHPEMGPKKVGGGKIDYNYYSGRRMQDRYRNYTSMDADFMYEDAEKGSTSANFAKIAKELGIKKVDSTRDLQQMYDYVLGYKPPQQQQQAAAPVEEPKTGFTPTELPTDFDTPQQTQQPQEPQGPDFAELFSTQIAAMQQMFQQSMMQQQQQYMQMQQAQDERMAALQQQMQQSMIAQQQRPEVAGVKMAEGTAGTPMQIARRGVTGAFGRRGMRISSLNV